MKKVVLAIFIFTYISSCRSQTSVKSVWTSVYEQNVYDNIDASVKTRMPNDSLRKQLVSYIVMRLKSELPRGLNSVSVDSINRLSTKIGKEYAYLHANAHEIGITPSKQPWTPELERTIREVMYHGEKVEDHQINEKLCECVITKLKIIYPDSVVTPFPHNVISKVAEECHDLIKNKKQ